MTLLGEKNKKQAHRYSLANSLTLTQSLSLTLYLSHTHTLSHTNTHAHTHTHDVRKKANTHVARAVSASRAVQRHDHGTRIFMCSISGKPYWYYYYYFTTTATMSLRKPVANGDRCRAPTNASTLLARSPSFPPSFAHSLDLAVSPSSFLPP